MNSNKENKSDENHEDDVVLKAFLQLLEKDIEEHPENLTPLTKERLNYWRTLGGNTEQNLNDPLPPFES
jgi:hypothetical protein